MIIVEGEDITFYPTRQFGTAPAAFFIDLVWGYSRGLTDPEVIAVLPDVARPPDPGSPGQGNIRLDFILYPS